MLKPELDEALEYYYGDDISCLLYYVDWYLYKFVYDEDLVIRIINLYKQGKIKDQTVENIFYELEPELYGTASDIDNGSIYLMGNEEFIEEFILPEYEDEEEMEKELGETNREIVSNYIEHDYSFKHDLADLDDIESVLIVEN